MEKLSLLDGDILVQVTSQYGEGCSLDYCDLTAPYGWTTILEGE
jgi:hypothetical protein